MNYLYKKKGDKRYVGCCMYLYDDQGAGLEFLDLLHLYICNEG